MRRVAWLALLSLVACGGSHAVRDAPTASLVALPQGVLLASREPPAERPFASVDLATDEGAGLVAAAWRYVPATIDRVESATPGPDLRPSGPLGPTLDVTPRPGRDGFDEAAWEPITPAALSARRGGGHFSLGWYRTEITLPASLGDRPIEGACVTLELVVDDYGEVWIDGHSPRRVGLRGETVVSGFNAPNRVRLTEHAHAGQRFAIAVLAMNGPVSVSPPNFHWIRSAVLDVSDAQTPPAIGSVEGLDGLGARTLEHVATGFGELAGLALEPGGTVLLADARDATIFRYEPGLRVSAFRTHAGYVGLDPRAMERPGATDVLVMADERVIYAEPTARRVTRSERTGALVTLAPDLLGPRALALAEDGTLYVADAADDGEGRVLALSEGAAPRVLAEHLSSPRGLALAAGGTLLVADAQGVRPLSGEALGAPLMEEPAFDVAVDADGRIFVATERGVVVLDAHGTSLGALVTPSGARGLAVSETSVLVALAHDLLRWQRTPAPASP